jgi:uncharacterized protein
MKKMQWYNEPEKWHIIDNSSLSMYVTPNTDFWRETHYGFTVDDGPFYYCTVGGEFELNIKITGEYKSRFDQMGLMIRKDEKTWIKTGVEYVNEKINLSAVVTHEKSDWSMVELKQNPKSIWLKVIRRRDAVEIKYSLDNKDFTMMRLAFFPDNVPVMVGLTAASPDGDGFNALFESFDIKHLPDIRRKKWLEKNKIE